LADEKIMKDVIKTNIGQPPIFADGNKINGPQLVQIVDYEGVSPLYLATTLCRSNIVRIILTYQDYKGMRGSRPGRQLANQAAIPAPDNQILFGCWPGRQQIPASGVTNQTCPQNGTIGIPALPGSMAREPNQIVASFSGPGGKTAMHAAVVLNEGYTYLPLSLVLVPVPSPLRIIRT
jgi:hypothetical protein